MSSSRFFKASGVEMGKMEFTVKFMITFEKYPFYLIKNLILNMRRLPEVFCC